MRIVTLSIAACLCLQSIAMPAYPFKTSVLQPDGETVELQICGDENMKYALTVNGGHAVMCDADGIWRYVIPARDGKTFAVTNHAATNHPSDSALRLLSCIPQGWLPSAPAETTERMRVAPASSASTAARGNVVGERKALIVLAEFPDVRFKRTTEDFNRLFNLSDYSEDGATGSVADYFRDASDGLLSMESVISGPFTLAHNMSYYGRNFSSGSIDANPFEMFREALDYAGKQINLKDYDCNGDGFIDNIHIIYSGYGEEAGASSNAIWAHEATFEPMEVMPGLKVDRYSCSPELRGNSGSSITTIGPPCHEICHALGAMDYYDTDYESGGAYSGTGMWDIMAQGSWNNNGHTPAYPNPYVRAYDFGWTDPITLQADGTYSFDTSGEKRIYRIDTPDAGDYFLLDFHRPGTVSRWEPGAGLLIFHISPAIDHYSQSNRINATFPQHCYPVCASSDYAYPRKLAETFGNINSGGCPFPGSSNNREFTPATVPAAVTFDKNDAGFSVTDITECDNGSIAFRFTGSGNQPGNLDSSVLLHESFERDKQWTNWTQQQISGYASWTRTAAFGDVPDGKYFLKLTKKPESINPLTIATTLTSPLFACDSNENQSEAQPVKITISFQVKSSMTEPSSFSVTLTQRGAHLLARQLKIEKSEEWSEQSLDVEIPSGNHPELQLGILAEVNATCKGNLCIDNIRVTATRPHAALETTFDHGNTPADVAVYNLSGCKVLSATSTASMQQIIDSLRTGSSLPSGIYVLRRGADTQKFMLH